MTFGGFAGFEVATELITFEDGVALLPEPVEELAIAS